VAESFFLSFFFVLWKPERRILLVAHPLVTCETGTVPCPLQQVDKTDNNNIGLVTGSDL
jgi:hypothetical protein